MEFDLRRALTYLREDLDSKRKLLILGIVSMIPFANVVVLGYGVNIYRNAVSGKNDEDLQPEWGNAGDFILKGIIAFFGVLIYSVVAGVLCGVLALIFGIGSFGEMLSGGEAHFSVMLLLLIAAIMYVASLLAWSGFSLYAETLELSRAFRVIEVAVRVQALGKSLFVTVAGWLLCVSLVSWLGRFLPWMGSFLVMLVNTYLNLVMLHIMAQLVAKRIQPVLNDVVNTGYMEYTESVRAEANRHEDAFGHQKQGGRKASHYADFQSETSLTWSTDSDRPEEE